MKTRIYLATILAVLFCAICAQAQPNYNIVSDTTDTWKISAISPYYSGTTTQRMNFGNATANGTLWYGTTDSTIYVYSNGYWKPYIATSPSTVLYATGSVTLSASNLYKTVIDSCAGAADTVTLYDCTAVPKGFGFDVIRKDTLSTYTIKYKTVSSQLVCGYSNNAAVNNSSAVGTITALGAGGGAEFWTDGTKWYIRWQR